MFLSVRLQLGVEVTVFISFDLIAVHLKYILYVDFK